MDIDLSPDIKWVGGSAYRVHRTNDSPIDDLKHNSELPPTEADYCNEPCDVECNVEMLTSGKYRIHLPVPKLFYGKLIGMRGSTKKRIEDETRTTIYIPRPNENGDVTVTATVERDAKLAVTHINQLVQSARQNSKVNYFVSIPIDDQHAISKYLQFKETALRHDPNLDERLFSHPSRLHLTVVVLLLVDYKEKSQALDIFEQVSQLVRNKTNGKPLIVELKGLDTFTDDYKNCSVIFSKVESTLLHEISDEIAQLYYSTGLVKDRDIRDKVKLHFTLLNATNIKVEGENPYRRKKNLFDASILLKELKEFSFGSFKVKSIHLSEMGGDEMKYYKSCADFIL